MPVVILEGLYYEKILLVSQYTNPYSVITHKENGFIFDIDKDNDLLNYLIYISELDKKEKSELKNKQKFLHLNIVLKSPQNYILIFCHMKNNENR